jgi:DNA-directed RNA polymerase subunit RPC12/RpoP
MGDRILKPIEDPVYPEDTYKPWVVRYRCLKCGHLDYWDVKYTDACSGGDSSKHHILETAKRYQEVNGVRFPNRYRCPICNFGVLIKPRPNRPKYVGPIV